MLWDCIQPNGEHIPVEDWVYRGVLSGTVTDQMLVRPVRLAVEIREYGWPRTAGGSALGGDSRPSAPERREDPIDEA